MTMRFTADNSEPAERRDSRALRSTASSSPGTGRSDSARPIRVLCVDDHPLIRKGIASILDNEPDMQLVGEAENGREAVRLFRELDPDVTLMDLRMPDARRHHGDADDSPGVSRRAHHRAHEL